MDLNSPIDQHAKALQLFTSDQCTLQQAAKVAGISLAGFIELLGKSGIVAVDYPANELDSDLKNALEAAN